MPVVCARGKKKAKEAMERRYGNRVNLKTVRLLARTPNMSCDTYTAKWKKKR